MGESKGVQGVRTPLPHEKSQVAIGLLKILVQIPLERQLDHLGIILQGNSIKNTLVLKPDFIFFGSTEDPDHLTYQWYPGLGVVLDCIDS